MTLHSAAALQQHARDLANAFGVRLIESAQLQPEEAMGISRLRVALCAPITDETTYIVALHEIGHLAAPTGIVRQASGDLGNLLRVEEAAAWAWARHYALEWTPVMEQLAQWAEGTYAAPQPKAQQPPAAPTTAPPSINWNNWK